MSSKNPFDQINGTYAFLSQFADHLKSFNMENHQRLTVGRSAADSMNNIVTEIVDRETRLLNEIAGSLAQTFSGTETLTRQWDALVQIETMCQTPAIESLQKSLLNNEFWALQKFVDSFSTARYVEAPDIALLKLSRAFEGLALPKGLSRALDGLHVDTARRLSMSETVGFNLSTKEFYVEASPEDTANISETNILCSSMPLLPEVDESSLISFLNHLSQYPELALEHECGQTIRETIATWNGRTIDFDNEFFYHGRDLDEGACPYVKEDMLKAPRDVVWHGRYNHIGQSHYYFSDRPKGALREVAKHSKLPRVQIAKLKPQKNIRMIDLSEEITTQNKFLEYCRFSPDPKHSEPIKREYLLPCFVANCCKRNNIEGIKYYGSKDYRNYVAWQDGYFDFVEFEIVNI